ncbi:MAG: signal peptidase I, partial [Coriobacteriia bacterium]|nr:signal peptidase I [Coriobacteriia bacterium]
MPSGPTRKPRSDYLALTIVIPLLVVFVGLVSVLYVTHTTARVEGISMLPTLLPNDILLVTKGYDSPVRGDIVVVYAPDNAQVETGSEFVKRVIAVPGDEVQVVSGVAYVNGKLEPDSYPKTILAEDLGLKPITVPEGHLLVLGDNRPVSLDSRVFGPIPIGLVIGRVVSI